jgi:hypothetical protein
LGAAYGGLLATELPSLALNYIEFSVHYEIIGKYSKSYLMSSSLNYSWFMQYIKSDNEESFLL